MNNFSIFIDFKEARVEHDGFKACKESYIFWKGDSITENEESSSQLMARIVDDNYIDEIKSYPSEFFLVKFNPSKMEVKIYSDFMGKNIVFYYQNEVFFIASNDFYEVTKKVNINELDINTNYIGQSSIYNISLDNETIVNKLKTCPPSYCITVDVIKQTVHKEKYNDMEFTPNEDLTISEVAENTVAIFDTFFKKIKENKGDKEFGLGLSGGLDSRIIAKLALDNKLKISAFCIGQRKGLFFKTNGYKLSNKIRKKLNISQYKFIEHNSTSLVAKIKDDITYYPHKPSNIQISNLGELPKFDYMLNGEHGGVFFGEFDFKELCKYNRSNMGEYLLDFLSFNAEAGMLINKSDRAENTKFLNHKIQGYNTINKFDCFYKFFFEEYGSKSKTGFFESAYGTRPRYTPFLDRDFIDYFLTWPSYLRFSRMVQYEILTKHFSEFNKIEDESSDAPIVYRKDTPINWPIRFLYALKNKVFGPSLDQNRWIKKDRELRGIYKDLIFKNHSYIIKNFPDFDEEVFYMKNPRAAINFMKALILRLALINTDGKRSSVENYICKMNQ